MGSQDVHEKGVIIEILGPTGVGKSVLAIKLAKIYGGEVISADSMQVYKHFDVGTDKITKREMDGIIHHGINIYDAHEQSSAHHFLHNAWQWCQVIRQRGHLPIVCGGTALYLRMLEQGIFPEESKDDWFRDRLKERQKNEGLSALWHELNQIDSEYAGKIGMKDGKRILRGLEIFHNTGFCPSKAFSMNRTPFIGFRFIRIGLNLDRQELYQRINSRVDRMMLQGLLEETRQLRTLFPDTYPPFQGLGYKEICAHLDGMFSLEEAVNLIKQHSRNYAKRQLSWWRQEKNIKWFGPGQTDKIEELINRELNL